ncbi:MAG: LysR family transcriptional regulator [marine bacterium B5-7]|nr:MAG: LysR family transcriptional regulator [marine bacterium B5-7]
MEIRHLRTLVAAAEADSFADAAEQLFITPAAVSQQIRQLEEELGAVLFDRTIRPPRLNAHGDNLLGKARELVGSFDTFRYNARQAPIRGQLTIGSVSGVTIKLLPETLRSLTRRYPEVRVRIEEGSSQVLIQRVRRRELDAAIVSGEIELPETMEQFPIFQEPLVVIAHPDYAATTWRQTLEQSPFLRLNRNAGLGRLIDHSLKSHRIRVDEAMELDSTEAIVQMTLSGLGAGVVPRGRVLVEHARTLSIFPFGEPQVHRKVILVQRKNTAASELSRLLYLELQTRLAERD